MKQSKHASIRKEVLIILRCHTGPSENPEIHPLWLISARLGYWALHGECAASGQGCVLLTAHG